LAAIIASRLVTDGVPAGPEHIARLTRGMHDLKARARTLDELATVGRFYVLPRPLALDPKAERQLDPAARALLRDVSEVLAATDDWSNANLETRIREYATRTDTKLGKVAHPLRAALTGATTSPPVFSVMDVLGRAETLGRIGDVAD